MAGLGQRFSSADHSSAWNSQSQYTMGRTVIHNLGKPVTNFGSNITKRALFGSGASGAVGAPPFSDVATLCTSGFNSRPGSSQHNGEILGSMTTGLSLRSPFTSTVDSNPENIPSFFNPIEYNGGQTGPPRNFSEPSLFPSVPSSRIVGTDLSGSRIGSGNSASLKSATDGVTLSNTRNTSSLFSSVLVNETGTSNSATLVSNSSRGMKLDPSDFPPILTSVGRTGHTSISGSFPSSSNQAPLRNYVSVMSKGSLVSDSSGTQLNQQFCPTSTTQGTPPEFSKQDFPALPGQQSVSSSSNSTPNSLTGISATTVFRPVSGNAVCSNVSSVLNNQRTFAQLSSPLLSSPSASLVSSSGLNVGPGIQLLPNHLVANIPKNMICDQFGMLGLLKLIRVGDYDATLNMLAPGLDLSSLHSNWQTPGELHSSFVSPCQDSCIGRSQDMDYAVPPEYLIRHLISDRLPDPPMDQLSEETLFWLFYNCCREEVQLVVAKELYQREWRFHKKEQIWLTRIMGANFTTDSNSEQGEYYFWDPLKAQKSTHQMNILYSDLDDAPGAFRLSSSTLSSLVSVSLPIGTSTSHISAGVHSHPNNYTNLQHPQQLAAYQQHQTYSHQQSLLSRQQVGGSNSFSGTTQQQSAGLLMTQQNTTLLSGGSGSSSAATLVNLINARHQQQKQLSPTTNYFQPSTVHSRSSAIVPLFDSRSPAAVASCPNTSSSPPSTLLVTSGSSTATAQSGVASVVAAGSTAASSSAELDREKRNVVSRAGVTDGDVLRPMFDNSQS